MSVQLRQSASFTDTLRKNEENIQQYVMVETDTYEYRKYLRILIVIF